jgi:hypothetical protein
MAKPILVVAIPEEAITQIQSINDSISQIEKKLTDYHVLAYQSSDIEKLTLSVLNADKADDLDIEKLKNEINSKIIK